VKLYGIASRVSNDVDEWRESREDADAVLALVIEDEPDLAGLLYVAELDLSGVEN